MESKLAHIYIYVPNLKDSYSFYKGFLEFLNHKEHVVTDWGFSFIKDETEIWFEQTPKDHIDDGYHRRRTGLNHLAFKLNSKEDVDKFHKDFLIKNNIKTLYDTPKPFPEYSDNYYAVFFEDPDRIKIEVAYY